jgi:hypothetical protein
MIHLIHDLKEFPVLTCHSKKNFVRVYKHIILILMENIFGIKIHEN